MGKELFSDFIREHYEIYEWRHATSILHTDFQAEFADLTDVLTRFRMSHSQIVDPGGRKSDIADWLDLALKAKGWNPRNFDTSIKVDDDERKSPTHEVDCFKNRIALEIEWNNKDPFFDRDLNNFRLLFELRVISLGIIITKSDELMRLVMKITKAARGKPATGSSTTHMSKLLPRIEGGSGGGCPLIAFGIKSSLYESHG